MRSICKSVESLCKCCKKVFSHSKHGNPVYCDTCKSQKKICKGCKKSFKVKTYLDQEYCNIACYRKVIKRKTLPKVTCSGCSNSFIPNRTGQKYCAMTCYLKSPALKKQMSEIGKDTSRFYSKAMKGDSFSLRWELLWKLRPDLHDLMYKIEKRIPIDA